MVGLEKISIRALTHQSGERKCQKTGRRERGLLIADDRIAACSDGSSDWHQSDLRLSYNTVHIPRLLKQHCASVDDQLHD
jgi:hypothetical protein